MKKEPHKFYRLGKNAEESQNYYQAVEFYLEYSTHLLEKDQHIPLLWIHNILQMKNDYDDAIKYLLLYCEGCSNPHASKILREKAKEYESLAPNLTALLKEKAKEYQK